MARPHVTGLASLLAAALLVPLLAACGDDEPADLPPTVPPSSSAASAPASTPPADYPTRAPDVSVGRTVASRIPVPWGIAFLPDGSALVAERDSGDVVRVTGDGEPTPAGTVAGVVHQGEGGLLGLAIPPADLTDGVPTVFAYFTSENDNRIVRMPFENGRLGRPTSVLTGIPAAGIHNGGRLAVGPDGKLWVGTGEAGDQPLSQNLESLGGKILRLNLDGSVPADNPFRGSPVWTLGHRNVQGLAFDSRGQLWATEFGQNQWDELNRIERGRNYGWPEVEGKGTGGGRYVEPFIVWTTEEASPSGLAIVDDVAYVASLRGRRLWQVPLGDADGAVARFDDEYGRLRTVLPAPSGGLWLSTSNRDRPGREQSPEDDRIFELRLG
jgi:glucose/arabinose dehydrogenase